MKSRSERHRLRARPVLFTGARTLGASILLALGACSSPTASAERDDLAAPARDASALIQTDRLEYTLQPSHVGLEVEIPYVFTNLTDGPVYVVNCNGAFAVALERLDGERWVRAWSPVINLCLSAPIVIQPGERLETTLWVWGAPPESNYAPQFDMDDPAGVYRIVWGSALTSFQDHLPFGEEIPHAYRVSNTFVLRQ